MTEKEDMLREQIEYLKKQAAVNEAEERDLEDYLLSMKLYSDLPKDQYGHQYKLLWHPTTQITKTSKRSDLFNPDVLLGNIGDSKTLYFLQRDFAILHRIYDMGLRSEGIMDLFNNLYYPWVGQIRLTAALGGAERSHQSFLEPMSSPFESFTYWQKRAMKKKQKGRRGVMKYLQPQGGGEQEGGIYTD
jgi:hypothetical protein